MFLRFLPITLACLAAGGALADGNHALHQKGAVLNEANSAVHADFDIRAAHAHRTGDTLTFHMTLEGVAGQTTPEPTGQLGGAGVLAYVWPTTLDPAQVGFQAGAGILALAATSHPDFDDTPLFDENGDGDTGNDGLVWHSHWVVLVPNVACGDDALSVRDIPEGAQPALPKTWPGLPLFIDSPGYSPVFDGPEVTVSVPLAEQSDALGYDGVTSALVVNANIHAPLLCVRDVFDVASGDLSLSGRVK